MSEGTVERLTEAQALDRLTALRAAEHTWEELVHQYGSLDLLRERIDDYEFLCGDPLPDTTDTTGAQEVGAYATDVYDEPGPLPDTTDTAPGARAQAQERPAPGQE